MIPNENEVLYVPLGGSGEIGMNLGLYGHAGRWVMVDCGLAFTDDGTAGVDLLMADPAFIAEQAERLDALLLTHAHEDHMGAIAWLWDRFRCPVYATPFAAGMLRTKLPEAGMTGRIPIHEVTPGQPFDAGPFTVTYITMTHSIPEPNLLALRSPPGLVVHSGDWKLDPAPLTGPEADEPALRVLGDEGVRALICDSTNVFTEGHARSEAEVKESLTELVGRYDGKVAVACFASNVARLKAIAHAALANGRQVALVGRSLWRVQEVARARGYLDGVPPFLTDYDANTLPDDRILYICTGSQGEPRAALARIASDTHPQVSLGEGDVVIFSSRVIPGNERPVSRLYNRLVRLGVGVVTDRDHFVHVSGHPARDDLRRLYQLLRPRIVVPQHGEMRHLLEHVRMAPEWGAEDAVLAQNGDIVRLLPDPAEVIAQAETGMLALDGGEAVRFDSDLLRCRRRMITNGAATATVVVDEDGRLAAPPQLSAPGLVDGHGDTLRDTIVKAIQRAVNEMPETERTNDEAVREAARLAVRRGFRNALGKKPETDVHVVRVGG